MVFTGDTPLAGTWGALTRCQAAEAANLLYDTIFGKILPLGDHVIVCPAHGAGSVCGSERAADRPLTTIGIERVHNPPSSTPTGNPSFSSWPTSWSARPTSP